MRWTFMRYYEQCHFCGEKIRWWQSKVTHGSESKSWVSHRRCHIVGQILSDDIKELEGANNILKGINDKLEDRVYDLTCDLAAITAKDVTPYKHKPVKSPSIRTRKSQKSKR